MSWGPQQGPQGYPQPGYGQYPQQQQQPPQGYGQAPQPPPKKSMGAGLIVAIVAAVFALVVVVGGVAAYFVFRSDGGSRSSSSSSDTDRSDALKTKAEALLAAVKTGHAKEVEDPLLDLGMTPETAKAWFTATFEPQAANDLYGYWERQVFPNITEIVRTFRTALSSDETEVHVIRLRNTADVDACELVQCKYTEKSNLAKLFAAMKKPQPLYVVSLGKPGAALGTSSTEVFYFVEVKGGFAYVDGLQLM